MDIIQIAITLIVIGVLLWLAQTYIPMDPTIRKILIAVVVIMTVLWLLRAFGLLNYGPIMVGDPPK